MADLTRTPLTYLNGGKDALRERDYVYLDIARKTMLVSGSLMRFLFHHFNYVVSVKGVTYFPRNVNPLF